MLKCSTWGIKVSPQLRNRQEKDSFPSKTVTLQDVLPRYMYLKMQMISRCMREDAEGATTSFTTAEAGCWRQWAKQIPGAAGF